MVDGLAGQHQQPLRGIVADEFRRTGDRQFRVVEVLQEVHRRDLQAHRRGHQRRVEVGQLQLAALADLDADVEGARLACAAVPDGNLDLPPLPVVGKLESHLLLRLEIPLVGRGLEEELDLALLAPAHVEV
jgi:hypothetical protein